ncbi:MAG TPA: hypothetical protein ENN21_04020, partial [Spirochaetes bacterium]|nr:hypothetical protein [Spirochaetota bacterium]
FNDPLSEKVESLIGGPEFAGTFTLRGFLGDMGRVLSGMIKLLFLIVLFNLLTLLLHLIPVAGSMLYSVLGFMSGLFFLGFGFFEFPLDRRRLAFRGKLGITWRYKFLIMGLGLGFWVQAFIPVVGFLALNLGAIGATRLFMDYIHPVPMGAGSEGKNDA